MKKLVAMLLIITSITTVVMTFSAFAEDAAETVTDTIYAENFDTGVFTLVTNEPGTVKDVYKDGVKTPVSFAKFNGKAFSTEFPENIVVDVNDNPGNSSLTNVGRALSTGSYYMNNTDAYINFGKKYKKGIITIDFRMKRPSAGQKYAFVDLMQEEYDVLNPSDVIAVRSYFRTKSSSTPDVLMRNYTASSAYKELAYDSKSERNAAKGYNYVKIIVDLDDSLVSVYSKTGSSGDDDIYTDYRVIQENATLFENVDGSYADGISSIVIGGSADTGTVLSLDDIEITHTYVPETETPVAEIENLTINTTGTISSSATFNYLSTDLQSKTARLVTAVYNNDGALIAVKSDNATVSADLKTDNLSTEAIAIPADAKTVKAFVWDFATLKPYAVTEATITK